MLIGHKKGEESHKIINSIITCINSNIENILGFYLLYTLIEACRPINIQNDDKHTENRAKDNVALKWFQQAISHDVLLNAFISAVTNQHTDEQIKEYWEKHYRKTDGKSGETHYLDTPKDPISDPMTADDFRFKRLMHMASEEANIKYKTTSYPSYELKQDLIDQINNILKEKYPNYYGKALDTRTEYFGRPKEGSLEDRRFNFKFFDSETEKTEQYWD